MATDPTALTSVDDATQPVPSARRLSGPAFGRPRGLRLLGRYLLLSLVTFVVLFPVYTTVIASLKPGDRVLQNPLVPDAFTLDILREAWTDGRLGRFILNSLVVAIVVTVCQVATSVMSGYAFAMLEFPGRGLLFLLFLATLLVPLEATLVVNRRTIDSLGWLNSYQGLAAPFLATAFGTFLLRQVFLGFPRDLRDAARIDGAGHFRFLWHVALPVIRPTVGALALFGFLSSWNQYLWPNLITTESDMNTVQSGLRLLRNSTLDKPNLLMAGTVIAAVPIFAALLAFQRQLVRGLTAGAVKG
ncbi:MAG: carbohydrate ABC transporter permease [Ilumatobacter sp.]|uniref:carbohydrate ABC transporter permease n=1 Tax=Ilumatobacter sp. TaxID=1967498 RepID=UPI002613F41F|nr:carbohydrate ABC transporter permease [Ilumatobacter sp.]MDJ0768541.1 carbohydrate ABC transporter permease [Ilumatobacter sp.]